MKELITRELITRLYARFRHLILYGVIGSFSAALDFGIFTLLAQVVGLHYLLANCISVLAGISTSFLLNRSVNFRVKDHTSRRFLIFLAVGLAGLCLSNLILYVGVDLMQLPKLPAKLLSIVLVVGLQFLANKFITFKEDARND